MKKKNPKNGRPRKANAEQAKAQNKNATIIAGEESGIDFTIIGRVEATWWTPEGFISRGKPAVPMDFYAGDYVVITETGPASIHRSLHDGHILVALDRIGEDLQTEFYVEEKHKHAFFATWYMEHVSRVAQVRQAEHLEKIAGVLARNADAVAA